MRLVDFTSSRYLAIAHSSGDLPPWTDLTTGRPAILDESATVRSTARAVAGLVGRPRGVLYPSSLHAFVDLWAVLGRDGGTVVVDAAAYPIGRLALGAAGRGLAVRVSAHHDVASVVHQLGRTPAGRTRAVLIDSYCPGCGRCAPIDDLLAVTAAAGAWLVIDDTQSLGIFGREPIRHPPYGLGGSGSLGHGRGGPRTVVVASLAKALGAPLAALCGSRDLADDVERNGPLREHGSPVSSVAVLAAARALAVNRIEGDERRARLARAVRGWREGAEGAGFTLGAASSHPSQSIVVRDDRVIGLHRMLSRHGIRTVPLARRCLRDGPSLAFLFTAGHTSADVALSVAALSTASSRGERSA